MSNTCRTTALNVVEALLGFTTDLSKYFFISPKYQTTVEAGQPNKDSFYIFPPPPTVYKENLSDKQFIILNRLYKRMEEIPKLNPESPKTRAKFEALKSTYKDIAGANQLSATVLMQKILEHESNNKTALTDKRAPNFLSRFFSLSSSTEKMFKEVKSTLQKDVDREKQENDEGSDLHL